jgi:hypothetical protein
MAMTAQSNHRFYFILFFSLLIALVSCRKNDNKSPVPSTEKITIPVSFVWGGAPLYLQTTGYSIFDDYDVRITRLQLFISNPFVDPKPQQAESGYFYLDLADGETHSIEVLQTADKTPNSITFIAGLAPEFNQTGALGNEQIYQNMSWPDPIGGGYHHMKMEGRITNATEDWGFAFHTGKVGFETTVVLPGNGSELVIDARRWFDGFSPTDQQWNTMNRDSLMQVLSDNAKNVFSWKE